MHLPAVSTRGVFDQPLDAGRREEIARVVRNDVPAVGELPDLRAGGGVRIVVLGLRRRRDVPAAPPSDNTGRDGIDDLHPATLEQEPSRRPDLPVATKEALPFYRGQRHKACEIAGIRCHQHAIVAELRRNAVTDFGGIGESMSSSFGAV